MTNPLHAEIAKLRDQLAVANETIRQMRSEHRVMGIEFVGTIPGVTRHTAVILGTLVKHGRVAHERLLDILAEHGSRNPSMDVLKTQYGRLRKALAPYDVAIKPVARFGVEMSQADRDRLRALVPA